MNISTSDNDIIVALATPYGKSAIAVIRVNGSGCIDMVGRFLARPLEVGRLGYNEFRDGEFSEKLMAVCYKAPRSYNGEETVELYPHGNMTVCDRIIKAILKAGARVAERGEFTKRAFFNGKLDLMRCEALADIIDAGTEEQLIYGNKRFDGGFSGLKRAEEILKKALSTVEAVLHYGDELEGGDADEGILRDVMAGIDEVTAALKAEIDGYAGGRIVNDGCKVALVGAPNVGKSTLLNALVGADRAIVTPIAGTTRDTLDGEYVYNGRKFVIIDTAGIADTKDPVERIGIERARAAAQDADVVISLSADGCPETEVAGVTGRMIAVKNKCDGVEDVKTAFSRAVSENKLQISAKLGKNVTALKQILYETCPKAVGEICNHRQYACVLRCYDACVAAKKESEKALGLEIVAATLYEAYAAVSELYGAAADESVISAVFERFCVGK